MSGRAVLRPLRGLAIRVAVFIGLVFLTFLLPRLLPGDPLALLLSADAIRGLDTTEIETLRQSYHLSGTLASQFVDYLWGLARGDLGVSLRHGLPVGQLLLGALPWTLLLIVGAMPVYLSIGLLAGIEAGQRPHEARDRMVTGVMVAVASVPPFAAAIFLMLGLAVIWPLFPVGGAEPLFPSANPTERALGIAYHAALPTLALALHELARFFFLARGEAVALSDRPFMTNARARGIGGMRLRLGYFGRNLVPLTLARMADSITTQFGAVFFVEIVFSYPGVGSLVFDAMQERDYMLLQGAMLGLAFFVLTLNWVLDLMVSMLLRRG